MPSNPFSSLSDSQRVELYRLAGNVRGCASCRYYQPRRSNVAGVILDEMACAQHCPAVKSMWVCSLYEREPGAD